MHREWPAVPFFITRTFVIRREARGHSLFKSRFLLPAVAFAQTPEAKILVVDFQAVNENSLVGQDVDAQLRQYQLTLEGRGTELQDELKAEGEALVSQQSVLPPDVYQEQAVAYQQKVQRANTEIEGKRNLLLKGAQSAQLEINRVVWPSV